MHNKKYDLELLISLSIITFLNLAEKIILLKNIDSSNDLAILSIDEIKKLVNRNIKTTCWDGKINQERAKKMVYLIKAKNIKYVLYSDPEYPAMLREIANAPFMLFYIGDISVLLDKTVSVVGTRAITVEAKKETYNFSYEACMNGLTVVSGLAYGVDCFAHKGAIDASFDVIEKGINKKVGKTVAVLPSGIDTITPTGHKKLAEKIITTGGCLISEYPPGISAEPWRYIERNRIVASLSPCTVVMQAPVGSGALITAEFAMDYNRDVMFHSVAFTENAKFVTTNILNTLEKKVVQKKVSKHKLELTSEKFLEWGAPVVNNFTDYCQCFSEGNRKHCCKINEQGQLELP